jgi:hypothetical protein
MKAGTHSVDGPDGIHVELAQGLSKGLRCIDEICKGPIGTGSAGQRLKGAPTQVDRLSVQQQLVLRVAILVDDLHLLDNGRLARLAGTFARGGSARVSFTSSVGWGVVSWSIIIYMLRAGWRETRGGQHSPRRRILHSFLYRRASSSI